MIPKLFDARGLALAGLIALGAAGVLYAQAQDHGGTVDAELAPTAA